MSVSFIVTLYLHHPQATVSSVVFRVGSYMIESRGWQRTFWCSSLWPFMRTTERTGGVVANQRTDCVLWTWTRICSPCWYLYLLVYTRGRVVAFLCTVLVDFAHSRAETALLIMWKICWFWARINLHCLWRFSWLHSSLCVCVCVCVLTRAESMLCLDIF